MSRYSPDIDRDDQRKESPENPEAARASGGGTKTSFAELVAIIDQATAGQPTMSEFIERLQARGVQPVPSINARGLNGMSYRFRGGTVKGSDLGRAYTARGLQQRKGIDYLPDRDTPAISSAVERSAEFVRPERPAGTPEQSNRQSRLRDRESGLSPAQRAAIAEVGMFRAIDVQDLIRYRYRGHRDEFEADFRVLRRAGLVERCRVEHPRSRRVYDVIALNRRGKSIARRATDTRSGQQFYSGFVKPAEVRHDIGIYRMYQRERAFIEQAGGQVRRVVTDFEIKRRLMSELNRRGEDPRDPGRKKAIADRNDISIVNGRFVIPDLRVEYETREGELSKWSEPQK